MRIQTLEHNDSDFSQTNISYWATEKGYDLNQTFLCNGEEIPPVDSFDWLMVMGGSPHIHDEDTYSWLVAEKRFIRNVLAAGKPILGICLGAQLLADILGGEVSHNDHQEIGWRELSMTPAGKDSAVFKNLPEKFTSFHWHDDHCSLPPNCTSLASSEATLNQAFISDQYPAVGLQFHPEYTCEMVLAFTESHGDLFQEGVHSDDKKVLAEKTKTLDDNYWLMKVILDNLEQIFFNTH
ncbi:MAG: type 1 glutamine amidotransferase [Proteobacteria bacterium]|nr:type 1 glutamine amidotransferase [Pseudomonadota bacterium]